MTSHRIFTSIIFPEEEPGSGLGDGNKRFVVQAETIEPTYCRAEC